MLTLSHVSKSYGKFPAVEDISLEMEHGLYGMLAPNGAGKTTLIKMIATLLVPTQEKFYGMGFLLQNSGKNTGICWGICRSSLDITKTTHPCSIWIIWQHLKICQSRPQKKR